jgi:hypothetical protein
LIELKDRLNQKINEGIKLIEKEIKENEEKIKQIQAKLKTNCLEQKIIFSQSKQIKKDFKKCT